MQVVYDAFIAHQQAYQRCNLLIHRDVSAKNILIDENGRGVLNDWDLAKHEGELKRRRRHEKTGTWQFMSCLILQRHHSIHTIQDDMESFIYVMLYHALRYLEHNLRDPPTPDILGQIFDYAILKPDGTFYGGSFKETLFVSPTYLGSQSGFAISSVPFQSWWRWAHKAASRWILHHIAKTEPVDELLSDIDEDDPPPTISVEKLKFRDHTAMSQVFAKCLASNRWPVNERPPVDAVPDADIESSSVNLKRPSGSVGPLDDGGSADGSRKRSQLSDRSWKVRSEPVQFPSHTMITRGRVNRGISHEPVKR
ncbi:hypothetical protein H0H93_016398 [Arthromyces matolae]|nr:hypothetical protein H0H93_016398 [Arthromyces matolae]